MVACSGLRHLPACCLRAVDSTMLRADHAAAFTHAGQGDVRRPILNSTAADLRFRSVVKIASANSRACSQTVAEIFGRVARCHAPLSPSASDGR